MPNTLLTMLNESNRTRLIREIANVIREQTMPPETRAAGLTLIGWLARRMPGDAVDSTALATEGAAVPSGGNGSSGPGGSALG